MQKTSKKSTENTETTSSMTKDEDYHLLKIILKRLKERYNTTNTDILNSLKQEINIPTTIFTKKLSPLEAITKYLHENQELKYPKIAEILQRDSKTIWQAYKNAAKKQKQKIKPEEAEHTIPASIFTKKLSILEAITKYLKEKGLSYHQIGELLQRNERTIWTVYNRTKKK